MIFDAKLYEDVRSIKRRGEGGEGGEGAVTGATKENFRYCHFSSNLETYIWDVQIQKYLILSNNERTLEQERI